jgi:ribonuclease HI
MLKVLHLVDEAYDRSLVIGHPPLLLFTDSLLVVGAVEWGWSTSKKPPLIRQLLRAFRKRKKLNPVALYWVKRHSKIIHNETVDKKVKSGAKWSKDDIIKDHTTWTLQPLHS